MRKQNMHEVEYGFFVFMDGVVEPVEIFAVDEKSLVVPTQQQIAEKGYPIIGPHPSSKSGKSILIRTLIGVLFIFLAYYFFHQDASNKHNLLLFLFLFYS